jgi:cell division transport system permease protein
MSQFGKGSSKRGKPNYLYAIIGVALVLFLFGLMGWLFLGIKKSGDLMKEKLQSHAYINRVASARQIDSLKTFIAALPGIHTVDYTTREMAAAKYTEMEKDTAWKQFLGGLNPFEASIDFTFKASYIQKDSMAVVEKKLRDNFGPIINDTQYSLETVKNLTTYTNWTMGILLALVIILGIIVVISIDNTIRLAMYSNRFLMKTMQMVGATRNFIIKPLLLRAIINGLIASGIAMGAVIGFVWIAEKLFLPELSLVRDNKTMFLLFFIMIILGVIMCVASTYRSALKYLHMKLDDLY